MPNHRVEIFYMSQTLFVLGLLEKQKKETHPSYLEFTKRNPVNQIFMKGTYTKEGYRSVLEVWEAMVSPERFLRVSWKFLGDKAER